MTLYVVATLSLLMGVKGALAGLLDVVAPASCRIASVDPGSEPELMPEIFGKVIDRTPRGDGLADQLFYPIHHVARPIAAEGAACMAGRQDACVALGSQVARLVATDALKLNRDLHRKKPVSFVTATLAGNMTLRPIALYVGALVEAGKITTLDKAAYRAWVERRLRDYENFPDSLSVKNAQNLVLASVLTEIVADYGFMSAAEMRSRRSFQRANQVFRIYLDSARADGSLPLETRRGVSALKYSNSAVSMLLLLADVGDTIDPGFSKYMTTQGIDLHQIVGFVVAALRDETVIAGYAAENFAPTDLSPNGQQARSFMREHLGWMDRYAMKYPERSRKLGLDEFRRPASTPAKGYYDETLGLISGCLPPR